MVLGSEVRTEHPDRREGQSARGERVQDDGKTPTRSRRVDPIAGGVLREPEDLRAVREEGTVALGGIEGRSRVQLGQVGHELDGCFSLSAGQGREASEEIWIGETRRESEEVRIRHGVYVSR